MGLRVENKFRIDLIIDFARSFLMRSAYDRQGKSSSSKSANG